jgi:pyridoxal 5'-phosphate synthase pdxS subunit
MQSLNLSVLKKSNKAFSKGAAMLRTKGEAGTGNIVEAVRHARAVQREIKRLTSMDQDELFVAAKVHFYYLLLRPNRNYI